MPLQGWTLVPREEGEELPLWQRAIDLALGCENRVPTALADGCGLPGHAGCATLYGLLQAIYKHKKRSNLCPEWLARAAVQELLLNDRGPPLESLKFGSAGERADAVVWLGLSNPIRRDRAAVIVARAFGLPQVSPREVGRTFKDLAPTHWAGPSVYGAVSVGVLAGYGNDTFQPERCIEGEYLNEFVAKAAAPPGAPAWDRGGFDPRTEWQWEVLRDLRAYNPSRVANEGVLTGAPSASSLSAEEHDAALARQGGAAAVLDYLDVEHRLRYADRLDKVVVVDGKGEEKEVLRTFCNVYAHDYAHLLGAYLPRVWWKGSDEGFALSPDEALRKASGGEPTAEMKANRLYAWLQAVGHRYGWWLEGSVWKGDGRKDEAGEPLATSRSGFEVDGGLLSRAQHLADAGFVVLLVARAFSDEYSGHVAAVVPAQAAEVVWNAAAPLEGWHWELGPRPGVIERPPASIADPQRTPPVQSQAGSPVKRWQSLSPWKDDRFLVGSVDGTWRRRVQVWAHRPPAATPATHGVAADGSPEQGSTLEDTATLVVKVFDQSDRDVGVAHTIELWSRDRHEGPFDIAEEEALDRRFGLKNRLECGSWTVKITPQFVGDRLVGADRPGEPVTKEIVLTRGDKNVIEFPARPLVVLEVVSPLSAGAQIAEDLDTLLTIYDKFGSPLLRRVSGLKAYRRYDWIAGRLAKNKNKQLTGMVLSKRWGTVYELVENADEWAKKLGPVAYIYTVGKQLAQVDLAGILQSDRPADEKLMKFVFDCSAQLAQIPVLFVTEIAEVLVDLGALAVTKVASPMMRASLKLNPVYWADCLFFDGKVLSGAIDDMDDRWQSLAEIMEKLNLYIDSVNGERLYDLMQAPLLGTDRIRQVFHLELDRFYETPAS